MYLPMIDYLSFSVDVEDYQNSILGKQDSLDLLKEKAKGNATNKLSDKVIISIGNLTFEVMPNGVNGYAYILHNSEYEVRLAQFRSRGKDFYPIKIRIKSESLWSLSPVCSFSKIYCWVEKNFGTIVANKISRADLCCHTDMLNINLTDIETFKGYFKQNEMNIVNTHRKISGVNFGSRKSKIFCRIYDKKLETDIKRAKLWFYDIWKENGSDCESVWNVEFELKREFFKDYNIETVEDFFNYIQTIWRYCTEQWLVKIVRDRTRTENCSIDDIWLNITNCFDIYDSKPLIKRERQLDIETDSLIPATYGIFTTLCARYGTDNILEGINMFYKKSYVYLHNKGKTHEEIINEKMKLLNRREG